MGIPHHAVRLLHIKFSCIVNDKKFAHLSLFKHLHIRPLKKYADLVKTAYNPSLVKSLCSALSFFKLGPKLAEMQCIFAFLHYFSVFCSC